MNQAVVVEILDGQPPRCARCGEIGHRKRQCRALESELTRGRWDPGACLWCGQTGHRVTACPGRGRRPDRDVAKAVAEFPGAHVRTLGGAPDVCDRCGGPWQPEWPGFACLVCGRRLYGARELAAAVALVGG